MNLRKGDKITFYADRGGRDVEYTVTVRQPLTNGQRGYIVSHRGKIRRLNTDDFAIFSMTSQQGTRLTTCCKAGEVINIEVKD